MKPEEVLEYEKFLLQRIEMISQVVEQHFLLLYDTFKNEVKQMFVKDKKKREEVGIVL